MDRPNKGINSICCDVYTRSIHLPLRLKKLFAEMKGKNEMEWNGIGCRWAAVILVLCARLFIVGSGRQLTDIRPRFPFIPIRLIRTIWTKRRNQKFN